MTDGSRKAILAAFLANMGIAITKFVGFLLTGSASLLAETVHSIADTGNQALLFLGGQRAKKAATPMHPFGYGRERYFWAFAVALVLFSMGGMFALYEGIQKLRHPHEIESLPIAIGILVIAIALESWSMHTAVRESRHVEGPGHELVGFHPHHPPARVARRAARGSRRVVSACSSRSLGVVLAAITDNPRFDAAGSVAIGVLLVVIAIVLADRDEEPADRRVGHHGRVRQRSSARSKVSTHVERLIHMRTEHLGPEEILVGAKIEFSADLSADELVGALNATEDRIRAAVPTATVIYLEPDRFTPERATE